MTAMFAALQNATSTKLRVMVEADALLAKYLKVLVLAKAYHMAVLHLKLYPKYSPEFALYSGADNYYNAEYNKGRNSFMLSELELKEYIRKGRGHYNTLVEAKVSPTNIIKMIGDELDILTDTQQKVLYPVETIKVAKFPMMTPMTPQTPVPPPKVVLTAVAPKETPRVTPVTKPVAAPVAEPVIKPVLGDKMYSEGAMLHKIVNRAAIGVKPNEIFDFVKGYGRSYVISNMGRVFRVYYNPKNDQRIHFSREINYYPSPQGVVIRMGRGADTQAHYLAVLIGEHFNDPLSASSMAKMGKNTPTAPKGIPKAFKAAKPKATPKAKPVVNTLQLIAQPIAPIVAKMVNKLAAKNALDAEDLGFLPREAGVIAFVAKEQGISVLELLNRVIRKELF